MMKKLIVLGIVLTMVLAFAAGAMAQTLIQSNWALDLKAVSQGSTPCNLVFACGTVSGASDAWNPVTDSNDGNQNPPSSGATGVITDDQGSTGNLVGADTRAPLTQAGQTKTWNMEVYAVNASEAQIGATMVVTGWIPSGETLYSGTNTPITGLNIQVIYNGVTEYSEPTFTSSNPSSTSSTGRGKSTVPVFSFTVPCTAGAAGTFQVVASVPQVPEPGSLVALFSGFVGLVGYGVRRRK